ncbi:MAG: hypothetical protein BMS9Abin28_0875 [Anaerolineae bacterium]|nr:MAG: hypothetical protein BMS9Abin28_0875 [Anaerolineae bacterium]
MTLTIVHARLATTMLLFLSIAGIWGLANFFLRRGITGSYWGILAVGEILILAQLVVGVILWIDKSPPPWIHVLYGIVAVISIPGYYAYTKGQDDRRASLTYGLICLFLVGISMRAIGTAT